MKSCHAIKNQSKKGVQAKMSTTQTNLPPFPSPDAEEEKNNPKKWVSLSQEDLDTLANLFTHFNPKTVHTAVRDICIRLAHSSPRRELPYIALSTLGATHADLDFFKGAPHTWASPGKFGILFPGNLQVVTGRTSPRMIWHALSLGSRLNSCCASLTAFFPLRFLPCCVRSLCRTRKGTIWPLPH